MILNILTKWIRQEAMLIRLAFRRMRQEYRILIILLFAISLVTGFLALGPLYIRGVTEVDLRYSLDNAEPEQQRITLISDNPIGQDHQTVIEDNLGGLITDVDRYIRADYTSPQPPSNNAPGVAGVHACGFLFQLGQDPRLGAAPTQSCYQPFAFNNITDKVRLVQGHFPNRSPLPAEVTGGGFSDEEQELLELGNYNRGQVEAVVTSTVAEEANIELGTRFFMGNLFLDGSGQVTSVQIVGIVEPVDANDSFWAGNRMFLDGATIILDPFGAVTRFDFGLAFDPASYADWVAPVVPGTSYIWRMDTDPTIINASNVGEVTGGIDNIRNTLIQTDPTLQLFSGYNNLLSGYDQRVQDAEGPITFLAGAVLILLLYHLVTTVSLVLQQQGKEWSTITSRGGSTMQLFSMQFVTVAVLGVIAFGAAFLISRLFMIFLEEFGPLSNVLGNASLTNVPLPMRSVWLALGGAIAAILVLSLPSIPAAKQSLLRLKQAASRPPTRPAWATFFLDGVFILIGLALLGRLYANSAPPDTTYLQLMERLVKDPGSVIESIANNLTKNQGLNDPFNLIGPALFLTGVALLWLRVFPLLVGLISKITSRSHSLTTPLAIWNVERDPGHYAQLVLLLIGTLAIGTASIGLSATRDVGAWDVAQDETGGSVRVELDTSTNAINQLQWDRLDGVDSHAFVMRTEAIPQREVRNSRIEVVGLDAEQFASAYPENANLVKALEGAIDIALPGTVLANDARTLEVQVWSTSIAADGLPDAGVEVNAYLLDSVGVPFVIKLARPTLDANAAVAGGDAGTEATSGPIPTPPNQWTTLTSAMPTSGRAPYSLWRIGMASRQGEVSSFTHTIYLDYWQTVDENGVATQLENFEALTDNWTPAFSRDPYAIVNDEGNPTIDVTISGLEMTFVNPREESIEPVVTEDRSVLRLDYTIRNIRAGISEPSIAINPVMLQSIPAIVSTQFLSDFRGDGISSINARTPDLEMGDHRQLQLNVGPGTITIGIEVVGIINDFPTMAENEENFIILPLNTARLWFNQAARPNNVFDANQVWLNVPERTPTDTLKKELESIEGITHVAYGWDRYGQILREPLPSAIAGMLFAGFWISLVLSLLDFAFYLAVTAQQRSFTFGVLRSLGWNANNIWRLLLVEQITLVVPALFIGSILGAVLAYLILPFLSLVGNATLRLPALGVLSMIASLVIAFTLLLVVAALWLRRMSVNQVLRLGEE